MARGDASTVAPRGAAPHAIFDAFYQTHASFVWRMIRRLGVAHSAAEDVMQEVFLVVYHRLADYEERMTARAWLSAIVIRVVRSYRRATWRRNFAARLGLRRFDVDQIADETAFGAHESVEQAEAVRELYEILGGMNEARREVLVLAELEELTAPEIAAALAINLNTVYWRLRTARQEFDKILLRRRAAPARSSR